MHLGLFVGHTTFWPVLVWKDAGKIAAELGHTWSGNQWATCNLCNDNDNDTLREVPHQSNEGLALQARVSGP